MNDVRSHNQSATGGPEPNLDLAIVILNYNTRDLLRDCLRSVFGAPGVDRPGSRHDESNDDAVAFQVCVVDNASTDGSADMVAADFPHVHLIRHTANIGYSAGNNAGLRWFGLHGRHEGALAPTAPRYALLLNPDTLVPPGAFAAMVAYMDANPQIGIAGPRVRRPDGSLDKACRRSFPTPQVSFYRMLGLSRLFPRSRRFNAYNLEYLPEDAIHPVDSVVGAYMQVRREAIGDAGLLDEAFFMYGEDLDWAKRIKDAGWEVWYNGIVEITHVKEASSSQSSKARIDFYEAMWIFYRKHYQAETNWLLDKLIMMGIVGKGSLDVGKHLWRYCRRPGATRPGSPTAVTFTQPPLTPDGKQPAQQSRV